MSSNGLLFLCNAYSDNSFLEVINREKQFQRLFDFELRALMKNQLSKMFSYKAMPLDAELTQLDRSLIETELLSYSSLSACDLYRAHQLQLFEGLLSEYAPPMPNFTGTNLLSSGQDASVLKRRYFKKIAAVTLPQIFAADSLREPSVIKKYYPMTDQLLVAVHWPAPVRKIRSETWTPQISQQTLTSLSSYECRNHTLEANTTMLNTRKPLLVAVKPCASGAESSCSSLSVDLMNLSPVLASADPSSTSGDASSTIKDSAPEPFTQQSITVMPAGNAIIMVKQTSSSPSSPPSSSTASWLTIYSEENVLGIRLSPSICPAISQKEEIKADAATAMEAEKEQAILAESRVKISLPSGKRKGGSSKGGKVAEDVRSPVVESHMKVEEKSSDLDATASTCPPLTDVATVQDIESLNGTFFIHTEDDVRMACYVGASTSSVLSKKAETRAIVCLSFVYPSGLQVLLCTSGTIKCTAPPQVHSSVSVIKEDEKCGNTAAEYERYRIICAGATVVRHFDTGIYCKEILSSDGSRVLVRRTELLVGLMTSQQHPGTEVQRFDVTLRQQAPSNWTYIRLNSTGTVLFYCCPLDSVPEPKGQHMMSSPLAPALDLDSNSLLGSEMSDPSDGCSNNNINKSSSSSSSSSSSNININIRSVRIDAETSAEINSFADGRIIVVYRDGLREVTFPDGTRATTHQGGSLVYLSKEGLPSIEVDTDVDRSSAESSRGVRSSLSKRGDNMRLRVALPDGSAAVIKYDNRITSEVKGSIKIVRRDRTVMIVKDSGVVSYHPHTAWDDGAAAALSADSRDAHAPSCIPDIVSKSPHTGPSVTFEVDRKAERCDLLDTPVGSAVVTTREQNAQSPDAFTGSIVPSRSPHTATLAFGMSDAPKAMNHGGITEQYEDASRLNTVASLSDPLLPLRPNSTKFTIDLFQATCKVEDHEYNIFDLSLRDPLNPSMQLSGEVAGLKPTPASVSPFEPRLFVLNRSGDATEVLSTLKVSELERMVAICPDAYKIESSVTSQPDDLAAGKQHIYHLRQHMSRPGDALSFEEIFASRPWHHRAAPAALSTMYLERAGAGVFAPARTEHVSLPPLMSMISLIECMPLSQEGYQQLTKDFAAYEQFLLKRTQTMDLFQAGDDLPICDVEEEIEEKCKRAVRAAYKTAKMLRNKQREIDKEREREKEKDVSAGISNRKGKQGVPIDLALGATIDALLEEEEEEEEEDDLSENSDDDGILESAEEVEIRAAFESFAYRGEQEKEEEEEEEEEGGRLELESTIFYSDIRSGCIQVLNCHVSQTAVDQALVTAGYCDIHRCSLILNEFRDLLKM